MSNFKLATLFTVLITWGFILLLSLQQTQSIQSLPNEKEVTNKSIISIDNHIPIIYYEYTDEIQAVKDHTLAANLKELKAKRVKEAKRIIAEKLAEEKRVAEAKRIAEEKRQVELARVAEEKRVAELVAKREAKNKEKLKQQKKKTQVVSVSRGNNSNQNWIVFEATHYSAFCNTGCTGVTALGWDVSNTIHHNGQRVIAVDSNIVPLGSLVEVKTSYGSFLALAGDTGGHIKNHRVDILVENDNVANSLGRIKVQIRIIK